MPCQIWSVRDEQNAFYFTFLLLLLRLPNSFSIPSHILIVWLRLHITLSRLQFFFKVKNHGCHIIIELDVNPIYSV